MPSFENRSAAKSPYTRPRPENHRWNPQYHLPDADQLTRSIQGLVRLDAERCPFDGCGLVQGDSPEYPLRCPRRDCGTVIPRGEREAAARMLAKLRAHLVTTPRATKKPRRKS